MQRRVSPPVVAATLLAAAAVVTACVVFFPQVRFGYRAPGAHIAVETAAVLIALLVALLALGRFRRGGALGDLLLAATFTLLAAVNLMFAAVPAMISDLPNDAATWGALGGRVVGAGLLAAAAVAPQRTVPARGGVWLLVRVRVEVCWRRPHWRRLPGRCRDRSIRRCPRRWACPG